MKVTCIVAVVVLLSLATTQVSAINGKCRALALEGGGDLGAYQAGAFAQLVAMSAPEDVSYDIITGVSVGAINALVISLFPQGNEKDAADFLVNTWRKTTQKEIYSNWPGGVVEGALYKSGLYNNQPLKNHLNTLVNGKVLKRRVTVGATDADHGRFVNFDESLPISKFLEAVIASSAITSYFPTSKINGTTYTDGSIMMAIDLASAIDRCQDLGYKMADIIVDSIFCTSSNLQVIKVDNFTSLQMLNRYNEVAAYQKAMNALTFAQHDFPSVTFRYVIAPTKPLEKADVPLAFSTEQMNNMIKHGQADATIVMKDVDNEMFKLRMEHQKLLNQGQRSDSFDQYVEQFKQVVA